MYQKRIEVNQVGFDQITFILSDAVLLLYKTVATYTQQVEWQYSEHEFHLNSAKQYYLA